MASGTRIGMRATSVFALMLLAVSFVASSCSSVAAPGVGALSIGWQGKVTSPVWGATQAMGEITPAGPVTVTRLEVTFGSMSVPILGAKRPIRGIGTRRASQAFRAYWSGSLAGGGSANVKSEATFSVPGGGPAGGGGRLVVQATAWKEVNGLR